MSKKEGENTSSSVMSASKDSKTERNAKKLLMEAIIKKIDYYSAKSTVLDLDLYYLVKDFFKEFLELKYEFSLDDLLNEIDKMYLDTKFKDKATDFVNKIKIIEYADNSFGEQAIKDLIREFSVLARELAKTSEPEKKGFFKQLKKLFIKEAQKSKSNKTTARTTTPSILKSSDVEIPPESPVPDYAEYPKTQLDLSLDVPVPNTEPKKQYSPISSEPEVFTKYYTSAQKKYNVKPSTDDSAYAWTDDVAGATESAKLPANSEKEDAFSSEPEKKYESSQNKPSISTTKTSKKTEVAIKVNKNDEPKANKKEDKSSKKEDIKTLLATAKKKTKKSEVIELYTKVHKLYESGSVELQSKYYDDVMNLYKRISKFK
jgi:hypothetical protein